MSHSTYPGHNLAQLKLHQLYEREGKDIIKFYQKYQDRKAGIETPPPVVERMKSHIDFQPIIFATRQRDAQREHQKQLKASCAHILHEPIYLPACPDTHAKLYLGVSHEQEGRYSYMKDRNLLNPEDKYTPPLLSSYLYGWKTVYEPTLYRRPKYGRVANREFKDAAQKPRKPDPKMSKD